MDWPFHSPFEGQLSRILLHARHVNFVPPVVDNLAETNLEILRFPESEADIDLIREISDMNKWNPPTHLPVRPELSISTGSDNALAVRLTAIRMKEVERAGAVARQYRAAVDFACHGMQVSFTLYSNPVFVHVPKCAGTRICP